MRNVRKFYYLDLIIITKLAVVTKTTYSDLDNPRNYPMCPHHQTIHWYADHHMFGYPSPAGSTLTRFEKSRCNYHMVNRLLDPRKLGPPMNPKKYSILRASSRAQPGRMTWVHGFDLEWAVSDCWGGDQDNMCWWVHPNTGIWGWPWPGSSLSIWASKRNAWRLWIVCYWRHIWAA